MKKNLIRYISLLLAVLLLLTLFSGCGAHRTTYNDLKATDTLLLYLPESLEKTITSDLIVPYRKLYPDVHVEIVVVPTAEGDYGFEAYSERVVSDTLGGAGPDVLFLLFLPNLDAEKAILNHSFFDLTDVLTSDPDFHAEDYVDGVFDAAKLDGRLYALPLSYDAPIYLSDRAKLEEIGFSWDGIEDIDDFMEEMTRLTPAAAQRDGAFSQMLESKNRFAELFSYAGIRLLDYEKGEVLPDEADVRTFFEFYKAFFPYDYDAGTGLYGNFGAERLLRGEMVFWPATGHALEYLNWNLNELMSAGITPAFGTVRSQNNDTTGVFYDLIAVNAGSKNQLNAYNFVKMLLSRDMQQKQNNSLTRKIPVNKGAIRDILFGVYPATPSFLLTDEEREEIYERFTAMDRFIWRMREPVSAILWETMLPYLQDTRSYDDCLTELKSKLTFYLSE